MADDNMTQTPAEDASNLSATPNGLFINVFLNILCKEDAFANKVAAVQNKITTVNDLVTRLTHARARRQKLINELVHPQRILDGLQRNEEQLTGRKYALDLINEFRTNFNYLFEHAPPIIQEQWQTRLEELENPNVYRNIIDKTQYTLSWISALPAALYRAIVPEETQKNYSVETFDSECKKELKALAEQHLQRMDLYITAAEEDIKQLETELYNAAQLIIPEPLQATTSIEPESLKAEGAIILPPATILPEIEEGAINSAQESSRAEAIPETVLAGNPEILREETTSAAQKPKSPQVSFKEETQIEPPLNFCEEAYEKTIIIQATVEELSDLKNSTHSILGLLKKFEGTYNEILNNKEKIEALSDLKTHVTAFIELHDNFLLQLLNFLAKFISFFRTNLGDKIIEAAAMEQQLETLRQDYTEKVETAVNNISVDASIPPGFKEIFRKEIAAQEATTSSTKLEAQPGRLLFNDLKQRFLLFAPPISLSAESTGSADEIAAEESEAVQGNGIA